jgi:hypothetical protein
MMLPINTDLKTWAASLVIDFPADNIPFYGAADDWKKWGTFLIQENSFVNNGAPSPRSFNDWQTWAQAVFKQMANF